MRFSNFLAKSKDGREIASRIDQHQLVPARMPQGACFRDSTGADNLNLESSEGACTVLQCGRICVHQENASQGMMGKARGSTYSCTGWLNRSAHVHISLRCAPDFARLSPGPRCASRRASRRSSGRSAACWTTIGSGLNAESVKHPDLAASRAVCQARKLAGLREGELQMGCLSSENLKERRTFLSCTTLRRMYSGVKAPGLARRHSADRLAGSGHRATAYQTQNQKDEHGGADAGRSCPCCSACMQGVRAPPDALKCSRLCFRNHAQRLQFPSAGGRR